jgi:hypothetical protein
MDRILSGYEGRHIGDLIPYHDPVGRQEASLLDLELLSLALRCARYQALHGRLPASGTEAESTLPFVRHVKFSGDGIFLDTPALGLMYVNPPLRQAWTIKRR